jgi:hypothetical protein
MAGGRGRVPCALSPRFPDSAHRAFCEPCLGTSAHLGHSGLVRDDPPSAAEFRTSLVNDLHFEDDQGLGEIVWSLNAVSPDVSLNRKIELARTVGFGLLQDGLIELRKVACPECDGPLLCADQVARLRHDDHPWFDPENASDLLVQAGKRGASLPLGAPLCEIPFAVGRTNESLIPNRHLGPGASRTTRRCRRIRRCTPGLSASRLTWKVLITARSGSSARRLRLAPGPLRRTRDGSVPMKL